jgi:hypothetical protein
MDNRLFIASPLFMEAPQKIICGRNNRQYLHQNRFLISD